MDKLTIELVPSSCWWSNVRKEVSSATWDAIRKAAYKKANHCCEICNGVGKNHPVECHETWDYDEQSRVQKLLGFVALCPDCHEVKHIGLAGLRGRGEEAVLHLAKVNGCSLRRAKAAIDLAFEIWRRRSEMTWKLDLSYLKEHHGIDSATKKR